jgi:hypothetical protein
MTVITHEHSDSVNFSPSYESLIPDRIAQIDLEFDKETIRSLIEEITKRLTEDFPGTIRVRFTGRMVH